MRQVLVAGESPDECGALPIAERHRDDRCLANGTELDDPEILALLQQPDPLRGARGLMWGILISLTAWVVGGTAAWMLLHG
jgi:hypothetical protein